MRGSERERDNVSICTEFVAMETFEDARFPFCVQSSIQNATRTTRAFVFSWPSLRWCDEYIYIIYYCRRRFGLVRGAAGR